MDTHSWALDRTIIDVINDVMRVPAINATTHRLGSSQNLLDGPCNGKIQPVSALPQKKTARELNSSHPSAILPSLGLSRLYHRGHH